MPRSNRTIKVARVEIDTGHWQRTLGRHVWILRRAGIDSTRIEQEIARYLRQYLHLRKFCVPALDIRVYPRILAHWRHNSRYLDNRGQPRALRFEDGSPTFRSLVLAAVPGADASKTLSALKRYRWVAQSASGVITLRADGFLARGMPRGPLLNASLASLDALTDTCYASLRGRRPMPPLSHLQRSAYTDHFDREHLRGYEEFLNESSQVFLAMHEAWLKRHEVKTGGRCKRLSHVGVGVFAIRDR
jgi:hypothetical protein